MSNVRAVPSKLLCVLPVPVTTGRPQLRLVVPVFLRNEFSGFQRLIDGVVSSPASTGIFHQRVVITVLRHLDISFGLTVS